MHAPPARQPPRCATRAAAACTGHTRRDCASGAGAPFPIAFRALHKRASAEALPRPSSPCTARAKAPTTWLSPIEQLGADLTAASAAQERRPPRSRSRPPAVAPWGPAPSLWTFFEPGQGSR